MPSTRTSSLLTEIQTAVRCPFLSDLHNYCHFLNKQIIEKIQSIPATRYSVDEWSEALSYINKKDYHFTSIEEAKNALIKDGLSNQARHFV